MENKAMTKKARSAELPTSTPHKGACHICGLGLRRYRYTGGAELITCPMIVVGGGFHPRKVA
jgi:hypothetical protein